MKNLTIELEKFHFYEREFKNGVRVKNKCGRDFLYTALMYFEPNTFGRGSITPLIIDDRKFFGIPVPSWLAWTQIQFNKVPKYLKLFGLTLYINNKEITSFSRFTQAILFSRASFTDAITEIENSVNEGSAAGIDISIGVGGLLDHVLFVYGYDEENLYVFETTETPIAYEIFDIKYPQIMKLPKKEIAKRWTRFGRVWKVKRR